MTSWRRRLLTVTYAVGGIGLLGVCLVLVSNSLEDNDAYGGIASALVALGTVFAAIVGYLRRDRRVQKPDEADEELVARLLSYWEPELRNRRTNPAGEPRTIPLTWDEAGDGVGAPAAAVVGAQHGRGIRRLKLAGRLDENPDAAARTLATRFEELPGSKRLVVLGEPGAGKTFLAITLAVGLLRQWSPGKPVAVFLSLASWDPIVENLDDWMVREIASLYYSGRVDTARDLLTRRRVLPILDGLDELPEHARRPAMRWINRTLDGDRPLVLTCRRTEYHDAIEGGAPVLSRAPVVGVLPLAVDDIVAYLAKDPAWRELRAHVEQNRGGPVTEALATPLMLSLFGAVHDGRPADDLLDTRLTTRHEIEDHLVDALLDSAYPATPARRGDWTAKKARRWLTYLARHLHEQNVRDLSPWQLARDLFTPGLVALIALVPLFLYLLFSDADALVVATMVGVLGGAGAIANARKVPGRDSFDDEHNAETFGFGATAVSTAVLSLGFVFFLLDFLATDGSYTDIAEFAAATAASAALAVVTGLGFGLNELMVANMLARGNAKVDGREFLIRDRSSALRAAAMATVFVGLVAIPFATIAAAFGGYLGLRIAVVAEALPAVVAMHLPPLDSYVPWGVTLYGHDGMLVTSLWFAAVFAPAVLATRTWTWLLILRASQATERNLPWRLMRFLEDGRRRGILRGSGGYYQFGHSRLQERLVATAAEGKARPAAKKIRIAVAVVASVVLVGGLVSIWAASPPGCRSVGWSALDEHMTSVVADGETGCFATLADEDWGVLRSMSADPAKLADVGAMQPVANEWGARRSVYVVGELDRLSTTRWDHLLDGIIAAQKAVDGGFRIVFVHADLGSTRDADAALLTSDYLASVSGGGVSTTAVQVDIGDTSLRPGMPTVIGLNSGDLDELLAREAKDMSDLWLKNSSSDLRPRAFADGVSDEECRTLADAIKSYVSGNFDLRGVENAVDVLSDLADCGPAGVLVDDATARTLTRERKTFAALYIMRMENVRETIRPACERELGPGARQDTLGNCVAVSTAFRLANGLFVDVRP